MRRECFPTPQKVHSFSRRMPKTLLSRAGVPWLLYFALWTLLGLAFAGQAYLTRAEGGNPITWRFALGRNLVDWYIFALLALPVLWLARRIPMELADWKRRVTIHLVASIVFSMLWMILRALLVTTLELTEGQAALEFWTAFKHALVATFFFNVLIYWVIISVTHTVRLYRRDRERDVRTAELEMRLTQARLQALQMQLNPHFLFNTLHAISSLMHKDVEAADRMLIRLGDLLRYALESTEEHEVPLRQELDFLDRYIEIEKTRFGERLAVQKRIAPDTWDALLPNLLLQPIIENAIQHGIEPHARVGRIELSALRIEDCLQIEVRDNGGGLPEKDNFEEGIGLSNSRARLQQLYGSRARFELKNAPAGGLAVTIVVPWRTATKPNLRVPSEKG
jgi:two-component system, LytTR family, sensor kinase